jgi:hypothetical protein
MKPDEAELTGPGEFLLEVAGESKYQAELEAICGRRTEEGEDKYVKARLVLENDNPYDPNAVRVDIEGRTVGYLSREYARQYRKQVARLGRPNMIGICAANIRGGWQRRGGNRGHYGVWLDVDMVEGQAQAASGQRPWFSSRWVIGAAVGGGLCLCGLCMVGGLADSLQGISPGKATVKIERLATMTPTGRP